MRFHTYQKYSPELADQVDLQSLLDKLADFLLDSGFAGGPHHHPFWGDFGDESDRSLDALKRSACSDAIYRTLRSMRVRTLPERPRHFTPTRLQSEARSYSRVRILI